uniref:Integrase n=1 Tax=Streptomyces sp. NBC_00049 TaxID=2903617 RepID=A0AAU2JGL2_9ACTN
MERISVGHRLVGGLFRLLALGAPAYVAARLRASVQARPGSGSNSLLPEPSCLPPDESRKYRDSFRTSHHDTTFLG